MQVSMDDAQSTSSKREDASQQRILEPMTEIGLGPHNPSLVIAAAPDTCKVPEFTWTHIPRAVQYRCALQEKVEVDEGRKNVRMLKLNAFHDTRTRDFILDENVMSLMASLWAAPNLISDPVRRLPSDKQHHPRPPHRDIKSEALYFLRHTSLPSDFATRNAFAESAVDELDAGNLAQYNCDRHSSIALANNYGNGGLEGTSIVLFHIDKNSHNHGMLDPMFNKLVSAISQCIYSPELPSGATLMPAISTQFTEAQCSKKQVYNQMRMSMEGDQSTRKNVYNYPQSRDMNSEWLHKIIQYRQSKGLLPMEHDLDHPHIIPPSSRVNDPELSEEERVLCDEDQNITDKLEKFGLFKAYIFVAIYPCLDQDGCTQYLQLSALRLRGLPFADPIVALQQLCYFSVAGNALIEPLLSVSRHMAAVLEMPDANVGIKSLFNADSETSAASLMGEENLLKAVFMKANQLKLTDIDVGGRRMDVNDAREMSLYKRYCTHIQNARRNHWRTVEKTISHNLSAVGNLKRAQKGETVPNQCTFDGFHFISISMTSFQNHIKQHILTEMGLDSEYNANEVPDYIHDDLQRKEFIERLSVIYEEQGFDAFIRRREANQSYGDREPVPQLYSDKKQTYFKVVAPTAFYNHGVIVSIDTLAVEQFWKVKQGSQTHTNIQSGIFLPLRTTSLLMDLYFDNELSFDFMMDPNNQHILDENYMRENMAKLPPDMLKVYHSIQQWRAKMKDPTRRKCKRHIMQNTILSLCGKAGDHPIKDQINSIRTNADLSAQHNLLSHTTRQAMRKSIYSLQNGPMLQLSRAAEALLHTREITIDSTVKEENGFIDMHQNFRGSRNEWQNDWKQRDQRDRREFMNQEALSIEFHKRWWASQEMDVHFCNTLAVESLHNIYIAAFSGVDWQPTGTVMHMMDCGGTFQVRMKKDGKMETHMCKSPGCGADLTAAVAAIVNNVFTAHMMKNPVLVKFYNSADSQDKSIKYITTLRIHTLLGSGVMSGTDGNFDVNDKGPDEFGLGAAALEALKAGASNKDGSQLAIFTEIEIRGGNPTSNQHGLASAPYETSQNMVAKKPIVLNDCAAIFFVATNIQHNSIPPSTFHGGRAFCIFSSSPDSAGRIIHGSDATASVPIAADPWDEEESTQDHNSKDEEFISGNGRHFLKKSNRSSLKDIDYHMTKAGVIGYWVMWKLRRIFPFVHRHLMLHYLERHSTWTTLNTFIDDIQQMTIGSWRYYLKDDSFHRNAHSSFKTVTYLASHFKSIVWDSVLMRCSTPQIDRAGNPCVDLVAAFEDALLATIYRPPSIITMLSSMALWLATQMFDIQIVILSQLCLYLMGILQCCPLHVLALVARHGVHSLDNRQRAQYNYLADKIIDMCCRPIKQSNNEKKMRDYTVAQGMRFKSETNRPTTAAPSSSPSNNQLLKITCMQPITRDNSARLAMEQLFGPEREQHWSHFATMDPKNDTRKSTFCVPKMPDREKMPSRKPANSILSMPPWLPYVTPSYNTSRRSSNFLAIEDWDSIIAEIWATSMSQECCAERINEGSPLPNTDMFWKAAYEGTKMPLPTEIRTDRRDVEFAKPSETGAWYRQIIDCTSKHKCGVTRAFLHMCGMDDSLSRFQIMNKLFAERLLERHPNGKMSFPFSGAWVEPVASDDTSDGRTGRRKFQFGRNLHTWQTETHEKMAGIEAMLAMDVLWLIIAQGLYISEWKFPSQGKPEQVVHTRVKSQAVAAMMSMYVHTCLDKSSVPCNNGTIHLRMASPYLRKMNKENMAILFEPRVHDEIQNDPSTMLSRRHRRRENMSLIQSKHNISERVMVYLQLQCENKSRVINVQDKPLVPMESVSHMLAHYYEYRLAEKRLRVERPDIYAVSSSGISVQSHLATAIRITAASIYQAGKPRAVESSMFMQMTPTYCLTRNPAVEMPFVSSKHLYTCVLRTLDDGLCVIEGCFVENNTCLDGDYTLFTSLPEGEELLFPQDEFAFTISHGLRHTRHGTVHIRSPESVDGKSGEELEKLEANQEEVIRLMPFPVFAWPHLVVVAFQGESCTFTSETHKRKDGQEECPLSAEFLLSTCRELFEQDKLHLFSIQDKAWLKMNTDVVLRDDSKTLHVVRSPKESNFGRVWRFVGFALELISDTNKFTHPELEALFRADTSMDKVVTLSQYQWETLSPLHNNALTRLLHSKHHVQTPEGYWIPEDMPDDRMHFWLTWSEMVGERTEDRYLWFRSRESLKRYSLHGIPDDNTWTCHHLLLVDGNGNRLRIEKIDDGFQAVERVHSDPEFYKLRQSEKELIDQICEYSKKRDGFIAQCGSNNQANIEQCERRIKKAEEDLLVVQESLVSCSPVEVIENTWQQLDCTVLRKRPKITSSCGQDQHLALGVIRPHSNGEYLHKGQYSIEYSLNDLGYTETHHSTMDFVSASYGMVPEGSLIFIDMGRDLYINVMKSSGGAFIQHKDIHNHVMGGGHVALAAYYILNSPKDSNLLDAFISVMVEVHTMHEEDDDAPDNKDIACNKLLLRVPLFDDSNRLRISLQHAYAPDSKSFRNLVSFSAFNHSDDMQVDDLFVTWNLFHKSFVDGNVCEHEESPISSFESEGKNNRVFKIDGSA